MSKSVEILDFKAKLDKISPTACLAKWFHLNLYLHLGENHSCYHPRPHQIGLDELTRDVGALHNTSFKKKQRQLMLHGQRPKECQYCWSIEDLKTEAHLSDRLIKSFEQTQSRPELYKQMQKYTGEESIVPTVIEVSFSNVCNFKCVYCHPKASSKWQSEIEQHGVYENINHNYALTQKVYSSEETPYVRAWKIWWSQISSKVDALRLTGGEPLLHETTYELFANLKASEKSRLYLMVNSNMGVNQKTLAKFTANVFEILNLRKISGFKLYTSLESVGAAAEYARYGLNFELWKQNVEYYLEQIPEADLSIMCTYNLLCVTEFTQFLELILKLRKKYCQDRRRIEIDISYITEPRHLLIEMLPKEFVQHIDKSIQFMERYFDDKNHSMFDAVEISKMKRIRDYFLASRLPPQSEATLRNEAVSFFEQVDQRRGLKFAKTFPMLDHFFRTGKV